MELPEVRADASSDAELWHEIEAQQTAEAADQAGLEAGGAVEWSSGRPGVYRR